MSKKEIKEELSNNEEIVEEPEEIVEESKKDNPKKEYTGDLRGFKTYEEMVNYPNTPEFQKLDIGCKTEYTDWLKNVLKED